MLIFAIFSAICRPFFEFLNISKCSMMPRWHHSDSSSERYQEVKSIKTFYAAHISRSHAKSMFGNWTISIYYHEHYFTENLSPCVRQFDTTKV